LEQKNPKRWPSAPIFTCFGNFPGALQRKLPFRPAANDD